MGMTMTAIPPPTCHVPSCLMFMVDGSHVCHTLSVMNGKQETEGHRGILSVLLTRQILATSMASSSVRGWSRASMKSWWQDNFRIGDKFAKEKDWMYISFEERKRNSVKLVETDIPSDVLALLYLSLESFSLVYSRNIPWNLFFLPMSLPCSRGIFLIVFDLALWLLPLLEFLFCAFFS